MLYFSARWQLVTGPRLFNAGSRARMRSVPAGFWYDRRARMAACCAAASFGLLSGCYTTRPLGSTVPGRETRVFATLSNQASVQMAPLIGSDAAAVEGIVADVRENQWELRLLRVEQRRGNSVFWNRESVVFPAGSFVSVSERRLHPIRTGMLAGGITAGAIVLARIIGLGGFFSEGGDDPPAPPQ